MNGELDVPVTSRKCQRLGCGAMAQWQMGFIMRSKLAPDVPVPAWLGMGLCDAHAKEVRIEELLSDAGWKQICASFSLAGRVHPDRELTVLQLRRIKL